MKHENGSAIIWIFIGILLFGALSFAMMSGSRTSGNMITGEEARAYAKFAISSGNELKMTVQRLKMRGCTEDKISFENIVDTNYVNLNGAPDTCKVFNVAGGGMSWFTLPDKAYDSQWEVISGTPNPRYKTPAYMGDFSVIGVGSDCASASCSDLVFIVSHLSLAVCKEINKALGISGNPMGDSITNYYPSAAAPAYFKGNYSYVNVGSNVGDFSTNLQGKSQGCFLNAVGAGNIPTFYQVLLAR